MLDLDFYLRHKIGFKLEMLPVAILGCTVLFKYDCTYLNPNFTFSVLLQSRVISMFKCDHLGKSNLTTTTFETFWLQLYIKWKFILIDYSHLHSYIYSLVFKWSFPPVDLREYFPNWVLEDGYSVTFNGLWCIPLCIPDFVSWFSDERDC